MIDAKTIRPKYKGRSDFFSWQLYRFVKRRPSAIRIWSGTWNSVTGVDRDKPVLYIGFERDGNFIHARQLRNLCTHGSKIDCYAYCAAHDTENWIDVTDKFWYDYLEKGVCAIHGDRAHKFIDVDANNRYCEYCGKVQVKELETITVEKWTFK